MYFIFIGISLQNSPILDQDPLEAFRSVVLGTDREYILSGGLDGTTLVAAYIKHNNIVVANVGDSRAILVKRSGSYKCMSNDHKPNRPDERQRVESLGGHVLHFGFHIFHSQFGLYHSMSRSLK